MVETKIAQFDSVGNYYAEILELNANVKTVDDFLRLDPEKISDISPDIDPARIAQWIDIFDLFRIPKITPRDAELLYYANVNSVQELAHREAIRIFYKLKAIDVESYLIILQLPTFAKISNWIYYAKLMTKRIKHGLTVPMVLLPMITLDRASDLAPYGIYTLEEFIQKEKFVKNWPKILKMPKAEYNLMLNLIELIKIDGIDVQIALTLQKLGLTSRTELKKCTAEEIYARCQTIECKVKISLAELQHIKEVEKALEGN